MANRLQPINMLDFTGGLNLRADAFQLAENESPSMLNVEVDPRGGFHLRKGWRSLNSSPATLRFHPLVDEDGNPMTDENDTNLTVGVVGPWNPRSILAYEPSSGPRRVLISNGGGLLVGDLAGNFTDMEVGGDLVEVAASPHGASFAPWLDVVYIAAGKSNQSVKWNGADATLLTASGGSAWQNDYTNPVGGHMPRAEHAIAHLSYLFAANTQEGDTPHPTRVRWSHPNNPEDWAESDYIDIVEGDGPITALVPFSDHLLIFKAGGVWALFGYDADTWQLVNVTRSAGAVHAQAVAVSQNSVYFFSWPRGVFSYNRDGIFEASEALRPAFESNQFNSAATDNIWLGWVMGRLWVSVPYDEQAVAIDSRAVFVLDPTLGAWVRHACACGAGLGPFAEGMRAGGGELGVACHRASPLLLQLEVDGLRADIYGSSVVGLPSHYTTRWVHANWPTLRKSWRRPDLVMKERDKAYTIRVSLFRDYDELTPTRQFNVSVADGTQGLFWTEADDPDPPLWGEGEWGMSGAGSRTQRASNLGLARAVQLRFDGDPGKDWGVDTIVFKFIPRRFR
jgi:hypothetical protein